MADQTHALADQETINALWCSTLERKVNSLATMMFIGMVAAVLAVITMVQADHQKDRFK